MLRGWPKNRSFAPAQDDNYSVEEFVGSHPANPQEGEGAAFFAAISYKLLIAMEIHGLD